MPQPETVYATGRLTVRQWHPADQDRAFDLYSRWEVAQWLGSTPRAYEKPDEAAVFIERCRLRGAEDPRFGAWALERRDTGAVAGTVLLLPMTDADGPTDVVEVGWHLHPDSWGHGFATEAARGALAKGFGDGLAEIRAVVRPDNQRSAAVCRRLGMADAGVTERWYGMPLMEFRMTRAAWEAAVGER
ncbi:RimJ/RimL family protein N-acetyltransferase [Kitasatospora sp. GP30]|uniref:GNAT family N-acetyltransferase n=1 Tax=Kitasatospora sp. GP30 TaxID=3035084 RepID=UPI000C70AEEA|nr:GNAT family N-acetyltransferase [Kitasatospora sp. GP30]MDH6143625.1 RimJ/RimL family protein N-acetyltransferase [Kitasatospora sp. GP30]